MSDVTTGTIETRIPARLDRLPWAKFHWMVIIGLGTVWILDGLEVTMVGSVASRLTEDGSGISMSAGQIGMAAAIYVAGACLGALFFGQLTDRFGRKKLFILTLAVYITATTATAFAWTPWFFFLCRFFTGAGIGGEYAAINSAIDELIPARVRGRVDLMINGSYWVGSAIGSAAALVLLDTSIFAADFGWRLAFGIGAVLGFTIMLVRRHVPESPRWLFIHGREEEAEQIVSSIEHGIEEETGEELEQPEKSIEVRQRERIPFTVIARTAFKVYPKRAWLGFALFVGQAFIYNGVTFNLGTLFSTFFGVASATVPVFIVIYAVFNFLGPLTLGRLFDTIGRKPMISGCYLMSAAIAVVMGILFINGSLTKWSFEAFVVASFFFASAGASAAYLTVSEIFPMETRALAIAFFYAVGTAVGGITGPLLFGHLIGSGDRGHVAIAFFIGAAVMAIGGIAEIFLGVKAEGRNLEDIAKPLTAEEAEEGGPEAEEEEAGEDVPARVLTLRRDAQEARARAAEHRAKLHELQASQDADTQERREAEEVLAQMAELRARALHERADGLELRAEAGEDDAAAAERCRAAHDRADALDEQAAALAAEDEQEAQLHRQLADAASERAAAAEERARVAELRAEAGELGERAEATSDQERAEREEAERRRRAEEAERRIRERLARRQARDRQGLHRFRPGPGSGQYGGGMLAVPRNGREDELLDREIDIIARALEERGSMERRDLERVVGGRFWGPGRFRAALREAVDEGRAERFSRSSFGPPR
ncbi:MAG TPA: MFS transporter [Baekduia sp.]|nr:MFS transporter [Baekduia sp.]